MMMDKALKFRLDTEVNALYIRFMPGKVEQTVEWEDLVYIDIDAEGRPLGVEFVNADDFVPFLRRHKGNLNLPAEVNDHLRNTFR
jgi:uncharacterized protein YuzE